MNLLQSDSDCLTIDCSEISEPEFLSELADADALVVRSRTRVDPSLLNHAPRLRVVGRAGAGVDNIDLSAATEKGVLVMNTPGGNSISVAEHTLALMSSLARRIPAAHASITQRRWDKTGLMGYELHGRTLGLVGLGRIGMMVARVSNALGLRLLAFDPYVSQQYADTNGVQLQSLEALLEESDIVSLHLPLTPQTRGLMNAQRLALMKSTAWLINTARGALIVEDDLVHALSGGQLGAAALDVFENEPHISPALCDLENVVLTPHIAGSTREAQAHVGITIARQILSYLKQGLIENAVNFPSLSGEETRELAPYLSLVERMGAFLGKISRVAASEISVEYFGAVAQLDTKPLTNYLLKSILTPILSKTLNAVNARNVAGQRGISILETSSSRPRSYSNLIRVEIRGQSPAALESMEGAVLHQGRPWVISVDDIPVEIPLQGHLLFVRNVDTPGVIGQVGQILGEEQLNIANFVLGRNTDQADAVGISITDDSISARVLERIRQAEAVSFAEVIALK